MMILPEPHSVSEKDSGSRPKQSVAGSRYSACIRAVRDGHNFGEYVPVQQHL